MRIQRQRQADAERRHLLKRPLSLSQGKASPPSDTEMRFGRDSGRPTRNDDDGPFPYLLSTVGFSHNPSFLPPLNIFHFHRSFPPSFLPPLISYPTRRRTIARVESGDAPPLRSSPFLLLLLPKENRRKEEERGRKLCDKNADALSFPVARRKTLPFPPSSSSLSIARAGRRKSFSSSSLFSFPTKIFPLTR